MFTVWRDLKTICSGVVAASLIQLHKSSRAVVLHSCGAALQNVCNHELFKSVQTVKVFETSLYYTLINRSVYRVAAWVKL